jgi:hypothetical protein
MVLAVAHSHAALGPPRALRALSVRQLVAHHRRTADHAADRRFIHDGPQFQGIVAVKQLLPLRACLAKAA